MIKVIGPSGFGDAIYMRVIMEWLIDNRPGEYSILTKYPYIFSDLNINKEGFDKRKEVSYKFSYLGGKKGPFSQWEDLIKSEGLPNFSLTSILKKREPKNKTIVIPPYEPMGGVDSSLPMKPIEKDFFDFVSCFANVFYIHGRYKFSWLIDQFNSADLVISQVGWAVPLAEMVDAPIITIFTRRALNSSNSFISTITPNKIKTKPTTFISVME